MFSYRHVWQCLLLTKLFFINIQTYPNEFVYVSSCVCSIVCLINLFDWFFIKQKNIFFIICISFTAYYEMKMNKKISLAFRLWNLILLWILSESLHTIRIRYEMTENIYIYFSIFVYLWGILHTQREKWWYEMT